MSRAARVRAFLAAAPEIGPGTQVTERVCLKEPIATGGMGTVWRAEHTTLGVDVAVKLLTDDVRDDPEALTRFRNEASTASKLASAHVVKVLDFGLFQEETPFLVMELLPGEDLASLLSRQGPRPAREVGEIVTQAARGLTAAHRLGCIHRDVKPQNLFLATVDGATVVKLLDFGVARRPVVSATATTKSGQLLGTPLYMGPEQLTNPTAIDARADLWSLAVVAYEALTGALPFAGETVGALAIAVDRGVFTPPSKRVPGLGPDLDRWFEKAFARDVAARFQTPDELAEALHAAIAARPRRTFGPLVGLGLATLAVAAFVVLRKGTPPAAPAPANGVSETASDVRTPAEVTTQARGAVEVSATVVATAGSATLPAIRKASAKATSAAAAAATPVAPNTAQSQRKDRGF